MLRPAGFHLAMGVLCLSACSLAWDDLDPREEVAATSSSSSAGRASTTSSTSATAASTVGSGGQGGAGGGVASGGASSTSVSSSASSSSSGGGGVNCTVPGGQPSTQNDMGCTGNLLASGTMNGSDEGSVAAANCVANYEPGGTCCSYTLIGEGAWYLTDGTAVANGGVPDESFRSAGPCVP